MDEKSTGVSDLKVLIIDPLLGDEISTGLTRRLQDLGYMPFGARDYFEAIQLLNKSKYDLAVINPNVGSSVTQNLMQILQSEIPVIVFSDVSPEELSLEYGINKRTHYQSHVTRNLDNLKRFERIINEVS